MKELTRAEEQIMQVLWELEKAFVKDIVVQLPNPKPAYNTVSTIVRILEKKGFVNYIAYGKSHQYFPVVQKDEYKQKFFHSFLNSYFGNSFSQLLSFFADNKSLSINDIDEIGKLMDRQKKQIKKKKK
jgi:BlaI family transcriptional regulator, penicillinase repressor